MFRLLFLLSFTLHNMEEALWLPEWSAHAGKFHTKVSGKGFRFAVLIITMIGYLLTFADLVFGGKAAPVKYIYLGFVLMMCFNALFPHLIGTIILKKYSPGTLTGLLLNLPIGLYLIFRDEGIGFLDYRLYLFFVPVTALTLLILKPLFRMGDRLLGYVNEKD